MSRCTFSGLNASCPISFLNIILPKKALRPTSASFPTCAKLTCSSGKKCPSAISPRNGRASGRPGVRTQLASCCRNRGKSPWWTCGGERKRCGAKSEAHLLASLPRALTAIRAQWWMKQTAIWKTQSAGALRKTGRLIDFKKERAHGAF